MGRYPDFLASLEALHIAIMALTGRRIGDLPAERSIDGDCHGTIRQQSENET